MGRRRRRRLRRIGLMVMAVGAEVLVIIGLVAVLGSAH